ncbi:hypothetical protein BC828DRAFT_376533 [Blastocladiella britannica]|nr:hypothetical protein BC828DRAFT_376533 [Blastocladiella britannica]
MSTCNRCDASPIVGDRYDCPRCTISFCAKCNRRGFASMHDDHGLALAVGGPQRSMTTPAVVPNYAYAAHDLPPQVATDMDPVPVPVSAPSLSGRPPVAGGGGLGVQFVPTPGNSLGLAPTTGGPPPPYNGPPSLAPAGGPMYPHPAQPMYPPQPEAPHKTTHVTPVVVVAANTSCNGHCHGHCHHHRPYSSGSAHYYPYGHPYDQPHPQKRPDSDGPSFGGGGGGGLFGGGGGDGPPGRPQGGGNGGGGGGDGGGGGSFFGSGSASGGMHGGGYHAVPAPSALPQPGTVPAAPTASYGPDSSGYAPPQAPQSVTTDYYVPTPVTQPTTTDYYAPYDPNAVPGTTSYDTTTPSPYNTTPPATSDSSYAPYDPTAVGGSYDTSTMPFAGPGYLPGGDPMVATYAGENSYGDGMASVAGAGMFTATPMGPEPWDQHVTAAMDGTATYDGYSASGAYTADAATYDDGMPQFSSASDGTMGGGLFDDDS